MLIQSDQSFLLVVDVQEKLAPAVQRPTETIHNIANLIRAAQRLNIPVLACEQYPKGLGRTVPQLAALLPDGAFLDKVHFSCLSDVRWAERIRSLRRRQAVVCGMETHVCVLQAAMELREGGYATYVVADATSSRRLENFQAGLDRMRADGVRIVTKEMVLFEWLRRADTDEFRDLLPIIK